MRWQGPLPPKVFGCRPLGMPDTSGPVPCAPLRAVLKILNFFLLRKALQDSPQGPPTANRQPPTATNNCQPPTATNHQTLFNTVSVLLCLAHVLTAKQRASP